MSSDRPSRGLSLPGIIPVIVFAAALCAAWLVWLELGDRGLIPGLDRPSASATTRIQAVEDLVRRGSDGVPELVEALRDSDPKIRRAALYGLGRLGPKAAAALPLVREALSSADAHTREFATSAFWRISLDPGVALPVIAPMMTDSNRDVREAAAKTLETIGPPATNAAIELLDSELPEIRDRVMRILCRITRDESRDKILEAIGKLADDPDPEVRALAFSIRFREGMGSIAQIRELLRSSSTIVYADSRGGAIAGNSVDIGLQAIVRRGTEAADLLPDLIEMFEQQPALEEPGGSHQKIEGRRQIEVQVVRIPARVRAILEAIKALQAAGRPAVSHLLHRLGGLQPGNQVIFAAALVAIGATADEMIPVLTPLLHQTEADDTNSRITGDANEYETARQAGLLLARVAPDEARRQVSLLLPKLGTAETESERRVLFALYGMASQAQAAAAALTTLASSRDSWIASVALDALKKTGDDRRALVPSLVARLERGGLVDASAQKRQLDIIETLSDIGPAARSAVPQVLEIIAHGIPEPPQDDRELEQPSVQVIVASLMALGRFGDHSPAVLAALRGQLSSEWKRIRMAALQSLSLLETNSESVLGDLVKLLGDDSAQVRGQSALAIGRMQVDRRTAVLPLAGMLEDENPYVRTAAAVALGNIGRDAKPALAALRRALKDGKNGVSNIRWRPERITPGMTWEHVPELHELSVEGAVHEAMAQIEPERP